VDRTVINVQSNVVNKNSSVLEVLSRSPGVIVNKQAGNISMSGKSGVRIMINGKMMRVPLSDLIHMLDGINAINVEKIELITAPPSKYEAEGNAGLINITMLQSPDLGTNGRLGALAGYNYGMLTGLNGNFNYRKIRFNSFGNYSFRYNDKMEEMRIYHEQTLNGFRQFSKTRNLRDPVIINSNFQGGMEFQPSRSTDLSLLITSAIRNWDTQDDSHSTSHWAADSSTIADRSIHEINLTKNISASLGLVQKLNEKSDLEVIYDFLWHHGTNPSKYMNDILDEGIFRKSYMD